MDKTAEQYSQGYCFDDCGMGRLTTDVVSVAGCNTVISEPVLVSMMVDTRVVLYVWCVVELVFDWFAVSVWFETCAPV